MPSTLLTHFRDEDCGCCDDDDTGDGGDFSPDFNDDFSQSEDE